MTLEVCPFCNGHSVAVKASMDGDTFYFFVVCWDCRATGPLSTTRSLAATNWNTRSLNEQRMRELERVSAALEWRTPDQIQPYHMNKPLVVQLNGGRLDVMTASVSGGKTVFVNSHGEFFAAHRVWRWKELI